MGIRQFILYGMAFVFLFSGCTQKDKYKVEKQANATRNLGEAYLAQGSYSDALRELLKADGLKPDDPFTQNDMGLAYMGLNRPDHAIRMFKKAIDLNPNYAPAKNNLGSAYLMKKDWDSAIEVLTQVAEDMLYASPHYPLANLGWAHYNKKEYLVAEKYYWDALNQKDDFFPALLGMGRTYLAMGRIFDAQTQFIKAAKINPDNPELLYELGRIYRLNGDYNTAREYLTKAISNTKDSELVEKAILEIKKLELLQ